MDYAAVLALVKIFLASRNCTEKGFYGRKVRQLKKERLRESRVRRETGHLLLLKHREALFQAGQSGTGRCFQQEHLLQNPNTPKAKELKNTDSKKNDTPRLMRQKGMRRRML